MSKQEHDAAAASMRAQMSSFEKPWYRSSSDLIRKKELTGLKCLDLCSGNGEYAQILRDEHQMEVTCADYIPYHLNKADSLGFNSINIDLDATAEIVNETAETFEKRFDMVVSLATIEHVFNSDNLLHFAHKVLKPGGLIIINTPNIGFLAYRLYSMLGGNRPFGAGHHIRFWDLRFLRTNLYLNGFSIIEDARKFYSLPQDAMLRAFRNRKGIAGVVAWLFHFCTIFQYIPFCKGLFADELTVMAQKDETIPTGFALNSVQDTLEKYKGTNEGSGMIVRLKQARQNGWLDEHLYLSKIVDDL